MNEQQRINYERIAEAIEYLLKHSKYQPTLDEVAEKIHLSSFHFQKLFKEWAGVSPKKFLQYISLQNAKEILKNTEATLVDAVIGTGLSGTGRLHDLFIQLEGMTPGEYMHGGKDLSIQYSVASSPFGNLLVASTSKGVCYMAFVDQEQNGIEQLMGHFPRANFIQQVDEMQENALAIFKDDWSSMPQIKLHLKATSFQLKVWETLLKIPMGNLYSYGNVADKIGNRNASRAVGTAIGSNPVAFLIPCHRVIQSSGLFGGYMWGSTRKACLIGWEAAKTNPDGKMTEI